jgi:hypothetical protein
MGRLLKFWSLPRREKQFFCEAGTLLLLSNLCVKTLAFRHIDSFLRGRWNDGAPDGLAHADDIDLVTLSLSRVANLLPWKTLCLSRSIAAFIMLRRRGIPAVMVAGVKFCGDSSLVAHAWIHTGNDVTNANSENSPFAGVVRIGQAQVIADSAPNHVD